MDGVSITYGAPRMHIWSYAAGVTEIGALNNGANNCPCSTNQGSGSQSLILLVTITTVIVNQATMQLILRALTSIIYLLMIHYGMASSVKVPAAMVPTLPHGSVYSFLYSHK